MMIRNDSELREAQARLADLRDQAQRVRKELAQRGLGEDAVSIAIAPQSSIAGTKWSEGSALRTRQGRGPWTH